MLTSKKRNHVQLVFIIEIVYVADFDDYQSVIQSVFVQVVNTAQPVWLDLVRRLC
jgi:hypothetical protein